MPLDSASSSSSTKNRKTRQYNCSICGKYFDSIENSKGRINDITFFDRNSRYDEMVAYLITDYTDLVDKLKDLAKVRLLKGRLRLNKVVRIEPESIPQMVSLLTDDARINSIVFGTYTGRDEASEYWQQLYNVFPDIKISPVTITADENGNRIVAEIDVSGTHKGMLGSSSGTGKKFSIRGAFVYDFIEGKIQEIRMYYDSSVLKGQLNILS